MAALTMGWGCHSPETIHARRKELIETVYASGKIISDNEYSLSALCTGRVIRKVVRDGDTVRKGQLLFLVSADDVRGRVDAAADNYAIAEANLSPQSPQLNDLRLVMENARMKLENDSLTYFRWKRLWAENIGTKNNLDNCLLNYQVAQNEERIAWQRYFAAVNDLRLSRNNAQSQLGTASKELKDYSIHSDRDGIVFQTFKESGEAVRINEVVALVGDGKRPLIRLAVDQQDIDRVRVGQDILVQADATGDRIYRAVVSRIYPVMNELDQTFRVDARFSGTDVPAFIHSSVEANIIIQKKPNVLVLPRAFLAANDSVVLYEKGKERRVRVVTGISTLDDIEILAGIDERSALRSPVKTVEP